MRDWVAIDIETTGLDFLRHGVCEVGMVRPGEFCEWDGYSFFLGIHDVEIDEEAMKINKYRERVKEADQGPLTPGFAGGVMESWLRGKMVICSPSFFDIGFLSAWFSRHGREHPWRHRDVIDLKSYAAGKWGVVNPLKNEHIGHVLGVEDTSDHTALADARWTAQMFKELIA